MMKRIVLLALSVLVVALLLSGCSMMNTNPLLNAVSTTVPGTGDLLPGVEAAKPAQPQGEAVLFFRYLDEPYLAQETRTVVQSANQSYEMTLVSALISGPSAYATDLGGLFPDGTRVVSTVKSGRTLFVTLSKEIMNAYPDEPVDWQEYDRWRLESPLRRLLCMQSLVATMTENCDIDQVQVLVESSQSQSSASMRLRQNYFLDDSEDDVLVGPMTRDASLILTAENTLELVLSCFSHQDWVRLNRYIAASDPQTGLEKMDENEFIRQMEAQPRLVGWVSHGATRSLSDTRATFICDMHVLLSGHETEIIGRTIRLYHVGGVWKTTYNQLTGWLNE